MDAYGSFERLTAAFEAFAGRVPFYGAVVACTDDEVVRSIVSRVTRRVVTYGFGSEAHVSGVDVQTTGKTSRCRIDYRVPGGPAGSGELRLAVPGRHNVQNALGAVAVGFEIGLPFESIVAALADFRGAERRYQSHGEVAGIEVIDDYGHHPTEIAAVLHTARAGRPSRVIAVFQPHRYTRTRDLLDEFGQALAGADVVVLTDIYPAGEAPIPGVTLDSLAQVIRRSGPELHVVATLDDVPEAVASLARPGDLVVTLGAGSIGHLPDRVLGAIREARS
jgi:UDP-N-acetylmuramate--alanine ligase